MPCWMRCGASRNRSRIFRCFRMGRGFLLAEFGGATQAEADAKASDLAAALVPLRIATDIRIYTTAEAKRVWHIRESGPRSYGVRSGRRRQARRYGLGRLGRCGSRAAEAREATFGHSMR